MSARQQGQHESGFTLIELLVVILIIGILAAVAVPVFLNQRKKGIQATVQSDLKSAALAMESEMVNNKQKYLSYVPSYNPQSNGVKVSLDLASSSDKQYCITAVSETYPEIKYSYDSTRGGILDAMETCTPLPADGNSFKTGLSSKKVLVVGLWGSININEAKKFFLDKGFGTVNYKINPPVDEYAGYDLIVALGTNGTVTKAVYDNLLTGYQQGYKIFTDGNDSQKSTMPFILQQKSINSGTTSFTQTGNGGLSPAFPYTYQEPSFSPDSFWVCPTAVQSDAIVLSTGPSDDANVKCITAVALQSGQGRWVHLMQAPLKTQNGIAASSIDWLML